MPRCDRRWRPPEQNGIHDAVRRLHGGRYEKDVVDIILLLLDHPLGSGDADTVDVGRIARLCGEDWGLWRTLTQNLEKVTALAAAYPQLTDAEEQAVAQASAALKVSIDAAPKTMSWRMRDRVGDRRQWWTDVDEVR